MLRLAIGFGAAVLLGVSMAGAQEIGGRYEVQGTNFDGSAYGGTATIDVTTRNTCRITWDTGTTSKGICMRNGATFSAAYAFSNGGVGLVIYTVKPNGVLEGLWTIADTDGVGTETLIPK